MQTDINFYENNWELFKNEKLEPYQLTRKDRLKEQVKREDIIQDKSTFQYEDEVAYLTRTQKEFENPRCKQTRRVKANSDNEEESFELF